MKWLLLFWAPSLMASVALSPAQITAVKNTLAQSVFVRGDQASIERQLESLLQNRQATQTTLARCSGYLTLIQAELRLRKVAEEMAAIPFVESRCENKTFNRGENGGIWSMSRFTGALYGVGSDLEQDERLNVPRETASAAAFLAQEYSRLGDWALVVLGYRYGSVRVVQLRDQKKTSDPARLQKVLSKENYYAQVAAAFVLSKNLKLFGF